MNKRQILQDLIETINATGGVKYDPKGHLVLVEDEDWSDLADVYEQACVALNVEMQIEHDEREDEDDV